MPLILLDMKYIQVYKRQENDVSNCKSIYMTDKKQKKTKKLLLKSCRNHMKDRKSKQFLIKWRNNIFRLVCGKKAWRNNTVRYIVWGALLAAHQNYLWCMWMCAQIQALKWIDCIDWTYAIYGKMFLTLWQCLYELEWIQHVSCVKRSCMDRPECKI